MTNVKCIRCGVVNVLSNEICKACGLELSPAPAGSPAVYYETPSLSRRSSSPSISSIGPFNGVGDVFGPAVTLFTRNIWLITKLVLVVVTPFEIFKAISIRDIDGNNWQLTMGTFSLQTFCSVLIAPALIYALMRVMQTGVAPGINEAYRWGLGKFGKFFVCTIMAWVLELLGLALCIVPGIFLALAFELVYPIAVLDGGSPTDILKRSYHLTKGHLGKILGATILMTILLGLASAPATIVASWLVHSGAYSWPIQALAAIISDILSQGATVLSLVIYLSIMRTLESSPSVIE